MAVLLKVALPASGAMPLSVCSLPHCPLPKTFLQDHHAVLLHGGVTLLTLLPPPWGLPETASGAAAPGKARWRRSSSGELPPTSRHQNGANSYHLTKSLHPSPLYPRCNRESKQVVALQGQQCGSQPASTARISLWTDAIHCAMCWLIGHTFPKAA